MLPQERRARVPPALARRPVRRLLLELAEPGVEAEHHREVIGLRGRRLPEGAPEAGDPVRRLATHHPLGTQVDGGIRVELEEEQLAVRGAPGQRPEIQEVGDRLQLGMRRLGESAQGAEELRPHAAGYSWRSAWAPATAVGAAGPERGSR